MDILLTSPDDQVNDLNIGSPLGKSDHALISFKLVCNHDNKPVSKIRFQYDKANYEDMKAMLDIDWESELGKCESKEDLNRMWKTFSDKQEQAEERCIPQKKVFINGKQS